MRKAGKDMKKFLPSFSVALCLVFFFSVVIASSAAAIQPINTKINNDFEVTLKPNIEYAKRGNISLKLHILQPSTNKPMPLIVFIQGSAWGAWGPQDSFANLPQLQQYFAKNGYVVASVQHTFATQAKFPAQIQDIQTAVRFLKANASKYSIDPKRVGVFGDSSGGHLAVLLATSQDHVFKENFNKKTNKPNPPLTVADNAINKQSAKVQAVVDWYGPTDFRRMDDKGPVPGSFSHNDPNSPESILVGGPIQEKEQDQVVWDANPINYVTKDDPPFLIMHGYKDNIVSYNQSILLYNALTKIKHDVTMYKVTEGTHGGGFKQPIIYQKVQKFFDKHLKKK